MSDVASSPMTVGEFVAWAEGRPGRYELLDGQAVAMAPERVRHAEAKASALIALRAAIRHAALPCRALPDGVTVPIDPTTAYEPDALVYCGPRLPGNDLLVREPVIVVEVLSPSTGSYDRRKKFTGYFSLPSVAHYLIVDLDRPMLIHHARDGDEIRTRLLTSGPLRLDPPGLDLRVEHLFDHE